VKFISTPTPDVEPQYSIQCQFEFETPEHFKEAAKAVGPKVVGDIPNFSNKEPILSVGDEVTLFAA
jgi:hypothetical protein